MPAAVLFRLRIAESSSDLDRVIYLDADTIVLTSLRDLWEESLGTSPVAAVRDIGFPYFAGVLPWRALGLPPGAPYFNLVFSWSRSIDGGRRTSAHGRSNSASNTRFVSQTNVP